MSTEWCLDSIPRVYTSVRKRLRNRFTAASMVVIVDWRSSGGAAKTWALRERPKTNLLKIFMLEATRFERDV
jgi:hypothetical protein